MDPVLPFVEVLDVQLKEVAHDVVEHEEAGCLLDFALVLVVQEVENGSDDFVHALHVLGPRVHLCKDVENPSHVVKTIGFALFLSAVFPALDKFWVVPVHHFPLLPSDRGQKGDHYWRGEGGEEGQLRLGPRCVFFDLLPEVELLLVLLPLGMLLAHL